MPNLSAIRTNSANDAARIFCMTRPHWILQIVVASFDISRESVESHRSHAKNPKLRELRCCFVRSVSIMPRHLGEQITRVMVQRLRL